MSDGRNSPDPLARGLAAFVRTEVLAPVAHLRGLIDILAEDATAAGLDEYAPDLDRMRVSGQRLDALVSQVLDETGLEITSASNLRHDLRTPVTAIIGYAELVAEEARENAHPLLFEPLADVLDAAGRLLKEFDRILAGATGEGPARSAPPETWLSAVEVARSLARSDAAGGPHLSGRILVVDDNASMRDLASRRLKRDGHTVSVCGSGARALDLIKRQPFDLVLLDLVMPGLNGLDVLARLRADPATRTLPVIVISAFDEVGSAVRCIEAGADDFLSKPLNETLLRARIASSLDRKFLRDREQDALLRLEKERERSEQLLRNVLPESVVERLRAGNTVVADHFASVTVLFCDLVGFTALSARLDAASTLDLLNAIFSGFDALAEENGLEKIKTIGDAYMVVGGMADPGGDHARRVVRMACGMPAVARNALPDGSLSVRIGIDNGPAAAGIIGRRKFFYDVWGDTVNTASRLETTSEPGRIHVSAAVRDAVGDAMAFEERTPVLIRGKGRMRSFYVAERP